MRDKSIGMSSTKQIYSASCRYWLSPEIGRNCLRDFWQRIHLNCERIGRWRNFPFHTRHFGIFITGKMKCICMPKIAQQTVYLAHLFCCREVEKLAELNNIFIRGGCLCNPGACAMHLGLSSQDIQVNLFLFNIRPEAVHFDWPTAKV